MAHGIAIELSAVKPSVERTVSERNPQTALPAVANFDATMLKESSVADRIRARTSLPTSQTARPPPSGSLPLALRLRFGRSLDWD